MKNHSLIVWIITLVFLTLYDNPAKSKPIIHSPIFFTNSESNFELSSIDLISPNGGENLSPGAVYKIEWTSDAIENVKIDYSTNNGNNWITIIYSTSAITGYYYWAVPNTPSGNCKLLVSDVSNALINDQSNSVFTINPPNPPVIKFSVDMNFVTPSINENDIISVRGKYPPLSWDQNYELELTNNNIYEKSISFQPSFIDSSLEYKFIIERPGTGLQWEQNVGPGDAGNRVYVIQPGEFELPTAFFDSTSRYVDFETLGQDFLWSVFANGPNGTETDFTLALNPDMESINTSRHCGRYFVRANSDPWSGVFTNSIEPFVLSIYNSTVKVMVYKDVISNFSLKLEGPELNEDNIISNTVVNEWETLTFDYSAHIGKTVNRLTIIPDFVSIRNSASINYFDNISFGMQPSLTLTSPNGGENWEGNSTGIITWTCESIDYIKIDYTTNNGVNWINVIQQVPAVAGNYEWIIPNTPSTNCKVLISDFSNALLKDESDNVFTISPPVLPSIEVTLPNGGEDWFIGSEQNLTWSSNDVQNVKIDYTTNNGTNWINIIPSAPASGGSFIWTVPNTASVNCRILISDVTNALVNDQSDAVFSISIPVIPAISVVYPNGGEFWQSGTSKNITWNSTAVTNIKIDYSTNDGVNWINVLSSTPASSGAYNWTVPSTPSTNCKILLSDASNALINDQSNNVFSIFDYSPDLTLNTTIGFGDITKTSSYKSIGLPGDINIPIASLMPGNAGRENDWRAFWDNGILPLIEFDGSSTFTFTPGKAFFIISKNQIAINQNVNAVQITPNNTYSIPLHNEWNLISNPFNKTILWSSVQNINIVSQPIHYYSNGSYITSTSFEPYKGYYFFNTSGLSALEIPYDPSTNSNKINHKSKREVGVELLSNGIVISGITLGVSETARNGLDIFDIFSPPSQLCDVSMSILSNDLETNYKYLQSEYRPEIGEGQIFIFAIRNNSDVVLKMKFTGLENFNEYDVYVFDKARSIFYDLNQLRELNLSNKKLENEFSLLIGSKEFIQQKMLDILPSEFKLCQNFPNPFNPATLINYQLPVASIVSIKVYDILGREITTLINDYKQAGNYSIEFNASGLSSGVYFYKINAGDFIDTKKMLILK